MRNNDFYVAYSEKTLKPVILNEYKKFPTCKMNGFLLFIVLYEAKSVGK